MESKKYIGMDVHQASISAAVRDDAGKLVMECVIETKAGTILEFIRGLRGSLCVTFEEGTSAAWLYDLVKPHVAQAVVCDPRKNALLKVGNKNDRVDARKLSELLRVGLLTPVYHGDSGVRTLRELSRSYLTVTKDLTRVMNRTKALYRSWAIPCAGEKVYSPRHRNTWLEKLPEAGVRRRAEQLYQQLDALMKIRREARRELLTESKKHSAQKLLRQIPLLGPIRVALLIALLQTPHRFRTKRQLWAYSGLALETRTSGEYRFSGGLDLSPFLTQPVKTQNPSKGELSHGVVEKNVYEGVQAGCGAAAGTREFDWRSSAGVRGEPERVAPLAA
jgi:transposase